METVKYKNITIIPNWKLIPKGYNLMTIFGFVCTRRSVVALHRYLLTYLGKVAMNHENIHLLQKRKIHSWIIFYFIYFYYWAKLFFVTFNNRLSYKTIPFEVEAYENQVDDEYNESDWKRYIMSNKRRKNYYKKYYENDD
jgi:hypothetical protein